MLSKTSKILIATAAALAVFASVVVAANVAARGPAMGVTLQRFSRVLTLTQDQTAEVKDILTKLHQDVRAVRESNRTPAQKRTDVLGLREAAKNKIESVLTISQKETADSRNLVNRLLMPRKPGMMMRSALAQLNLTPDQKTQIKGIMKDAAARGKAIRQDTTLSKQDKMAKLQENRREAMKDVSSVLTPDQRTKLQQWMQNHKRGAAAAA